MPHVLADIFIQAAEEMANDPRRTGSLVILPEKTEVILAGDLHGSRRNLAKILDYADLEHHPDRVLILQEIIHGEDDPVTGHDRSIEPLMRAVRDMRKHPGQVVFLLGNHDIAQLTGNEITKSGRGSCKAFNQGLEYEFEDRADEISQALEKFLYAMPLAAKCGPVLMSHSLPHPSRMELAGTDILNREYSFEDLRRGGPVYEWTWGRDQTPGQLDELADQLGVEYFILGHRHVEQGYEPIGQLAVTVASDHSHGVIVQFTGQHPPNGQTIEKHIRRINALGA